MAIFPRSTGWKLLLLHIFIAYEFYNPTDSGAVSLTTANLNSTIANYETGFINFYADWCQFSRKLAPEFDQAADELATQYADQPNKVIMAKVDCDAESDASSVFQITKFPTIKVILNGKIWRSEYRGRRTIEAFKKHLEDLLKDPSHEFFSLKELENLDDKKRMLIGYFDTKGTPEYDTFRRVASYLRSDCQSYVGFGDASVHMHPPGQPVVVFRPDKATSPESDETFTGDVKNYEELEKWAADKCVPLVREITFDNAEELTEESLPFLILFHRRDDTASVKKYKEVIQRELVNERTRVNFLTADGARFAHPLRHLGMEQKDLPLIAIDSFRHMYLFKDFSKVDEPGKLKQFLNDLYSGKLHREYHYGPDPDRTEDPVKAISPPESAFKNLAPSDNRYSLLRDEL